MSNSALSYGLRHLGRHVPSGETASDDFGTFRSSSNFREGTMDFNHARQREQLAQRQSNWAAMGGGTGWRDGLVARTNIQEPGGGEAPAQTPVSEAPVRPQARPTASVMPQPRRVSQNPVSSSSSSAASPAPAPQTPINRDVGPAGGPVPARPPAPTMAEQRTEQAMMRALASSPPTPSPHPEVVRPVPRNPREALGQVGTPLSAQQAAASNPSSNHPSQLNDRQLAMAMSMSDEEFFQWLAASRAGNMPR